MDPISDSNPNIPPAPVEKKSCGQFMMKLWHERNEILFILDVLFIFSTFILSYYLRFFVPSIGLRVAEEIPEISDYVNGGALLAIIWSFLLWQKGAYEKGFFGVGAPKPRVMVLLSTGVQSLIFLMAISFAYRGLLLSRQVYAMGWIISLLGLLGLRMTLLTLERKLFRKEEYRQNILLVGFKKRTLEFVKRFHERQKNFRIIGFVRWSYSDDTDTAASIKELPLLGIIDNIPELIKKHDIHQLVIATDEDDVYSDGGKRILLMRLVNFCEEKDISIYMLPGILDVAISRREIGAFFNMPMILLRDVTVRPVYAILRRAMDLVLSSIILILGSPFWLLIALAIKLSSKGPVIYKQTRVGLHGKPFQMHKFRSMIDNADEQLGDMVDLENSEEPIFNIREDPRVTRIGALLRRSSLDEIPQIINVIKGEMSLIGPRPERVELVEKYDTFQRRRLKAKPGITGYQQVMSRGDPSLAARIQYDLYYLKWQSVWLDLYILFKTLVVIIRGDGFK